MISFGGKKKVQKSTTKAANTGSSPVANTRPTRRRLEHLQRLLNAVKIGSRIRYHQEYEEASTLESLVIGYRINDIFIYRQSEISFREDDSLPKMIIQTPHGPEEFTRVEGIELIVPGDIGEERKLDYNSRANLGRRGPFAPHSHLMVLSTNFNSEHLKLETEVHRNLRLSDGVHAGLQVALLSVMLDSIDSHEPRQQSRVSANLSVTLCKNGTGKVIPALLLDISERSMRLALDKPDDLWPEFSKKDFALIGLKSSLEKPLIKLRCQCIDVRGTERIFEMTHVIRQGNTEPFEMIDALEIKVDLMNLSPPG